MTSRPEVTLKASVASFPPPKEGFEGPNSIPEPPVVHQPAPSWGSLSHPVLCHRPCVYLLKGSTCRQGASCQFCHHSQHSPIPKLDQEQRARVQGLSDEDLVSLLIPHIREQAQAAGLLEQVEDFVHMLDKKLCPDREHTNDNIRMKIPRKELYRLKKTPCHRLEVFVFVLLHSVSSPIGCIAQDEVRTLRGMNMTALMKLLPRDDLAEHFQKLRLSAAGLVPEL